MRFIRAVLVVGALSLLLGLTAAIAMAAEQAGGPPKRGCLSCHTLEDKATGKYTLGYWAQERTKADYNRDHPKKALDGASIEPAQVVSVKTCLGCHGAGTGDRMGKGKFSNLSLRDIVHPAHMFSGVFGDRYNTSCFTCHNVNAEGRFDLLDEAVAVNEKGIPKSLLEGKGTIPGALPSSEVKK